MSHNQRDHRGNLKTALVLAMLASAGAWAVGHGSAHAAPNDASVIDDTGDALGQIANHQPLSLQPPGLSEFLAEDDAQAGADEASQPIADGELDWSLLEQSAFVPSSRTGTSRRLRSHVPMISGHDTAWSSALNPTEGSEALSIGQPLPFARSKVGIDMTITRPGMRLNTLPLPEKLASQARRQNSDGSAWASATLGGVADLWDKTDLETRLDPLQANGSLAARFSRSVALDADTGSRLTLHGSYRLSAPIGAGGDRYSEIDQAARWSLPGGTHVLVGQSRSTQDNRWLARVGAEQTIARGVKVSGTLAEAADGKPAMSLSAAYHTSW